MADKMCFLLAWTVILCFSPVRAMGALSPLDPSSYSRPEKAVIKHISLALNVDFAKQVLSGQATLEFDVLDDINDVILDVSNLKIESIETEDGAQLQYKLSDHVPNFGSKLTVLIPQQQSSGEKIDETTSMKEENSKHDVLCGCDSIDSCVSSPDMIALQYTGFMYHALVDSVDSEYGSLDKASMGESSSGESSPEASSAEDSLAEDFMKVASTEEARTGAALTAVALKGVAPTDESLNAEAVKGVSSTDIGLMDEASKAVTSEGEALKDVASTDEVSTGEALRVVASIDEGPTFEALKVVFSTDIGLMDEASKAVTSEGALKNVASTDQVSTGKDLKGKALKGKTSTDEVTKGKVSTDEDTKGNAKGVASTDEDQKGKAKGVVSTDEGPKGKAKGVASTDKAAKGKGSTGKATIVNVMKHSHRSFGSIGSSEIKCCDSILPILDVDGNRLKIKIKYSTDPTASALQWLDPEQTSGKKHPYLFSQCQPIHARSILPCQDTPAVKFTYDAEVTAPEEFTVLMSALRGGVTNNKTTFRQPMPLPSYLVAIAVGVLESRDLGPRSKVWSEKEEIERSAWEFAETEKYLQAAEKLCGPYEWTAYDLLVLPPSFPYGGMENPCLTFVTPTLLAGDRSQADVIVHEIMHSWTGNLVTNRNFEHFWLNEGFTVFLERKVGASLINDSVEAKKSRDFHSLLGLQELSEAIQVFGATNSLTNLVVDLNGIHPDDAFSRVPYEKGSLFLRYLEDLVGGPEIFDDFLRSYLTRFSRKSLDTDQFKAYLLDYFKDSDKLGTVDWDSWLYKSGMPPIIPDYDATMTKAISTLVLKIDDGNETISPADVSAFTPHQMIHLLQQLVDGTPLPLDRLQTLGEQYKVSSSKNTEIHYRWLRLCVRSKDQSKLGEVFNFVNSQGRMKYVRPIYRDLYAWRDVRDQAIDNFLKNEKYMMHVSAYTLRKDLHLGEQTTKSTE